MRNVARLGQLGWRRSGLMVDFGHVPGSHPLSQGWTPKLSSIKCHMRGFGTRNGRSEVPLLFRDFQFFLTGRFFPEFVFSKTIFCSTW